jgi:hypothetical protein
MKLNKGCMVTKFNIGQIACASYIRSLSQPNLVSSFKKSGIFPFDRHAYDKSKHGPNKIWGTKKLDQAPSSAPSFQEFLQQNPITVVPEPPKTTRNTSSAIVGGREITNDNVLQQLVLHNSKYKKTNSKPARNPPNLDQPSTSSLPVKPVVSTASDDSFTESDSEVCCVCNKFQPAGMNNLYISFVNWAECDRCGQWVHLKYCTDVIAV